MNIFKVPITRSKKLLYSEMVLKIRKSFEIFLFKFVYYFFLSFFLYFLITYVQKLVSKLQGLSAGRNPSSAVLKIWLRIHCR